MGLSLERKCRAAIRGRRGREAGKMPALHREWNLNANVGRPFVVAEDEAGKMPALHGFLGCHPYSPIQLLYL